MALGSARQFSLYQLDSDLPHQAHGESEQPLADAETDREEPVPSLPVAGEDLSGLVQS